MLTRKQIKATLIHADPPYNIGVDYGNTTDDNRPRDQFVKWCRQWIGECHINLIDNGSLWLLISHEYAADLEMVMRDTGFTIANYITWYETFGVNCVNKFARSSRRLFHAVKDPDNYIFNRGPVIRPSARQEVYRDKRANPAGRLWDDVWGINPPIPRVCGTHDEREPGFPTQLPLKLLETIIGVASDPLDLVIDPFSGSATTGAACIKLRRHYIGIEISPEYIAWSQTRLERVFKETYGHEYIAS
jgi:site-specific DNA-methyltransferase (adenine-specific)